MIGGKTSTIGFKALGVETFAVTAPQNAPAVYREIELDRYGLLFVTEPVYEVLRREVDDFPREGLPVTTVVPAVAGSLGIGRAEIRELVERATGTSMFMGE
jgi:V/A-type H+-transporting ATPase subunit F